MAAPLTTWGLSADLPASPYPGLRPFQQDEWPIFFGRESMTDEVIDRLAEHHLVVVHGASGCGKSSLIRAGVLPSLYLDHARSGKPWRMATMRPTGGCLRNMARQLGNNLGPPHSAGTDTDPPTAWWLSLARGSVVLQEIDALLGESEECSFCLLIDQFEDLFRWGRERGREEAQHLIDILCELGRKGRSSTSQFYVIVTIRTDFLGQCADFDNFAETVNRTQYLLPRMDEFALLRAIHEPAALYDGCVDAAVGNRLAFRARCEVDSLPILQHTLMRASARARGRDGQNWVVTIDDLNAIEGAAGALSQHADDVLADFAGSDEQRHAAAEWVFRSLAELDSESRILRRPCRLQRLGQIAGDNAELVRELVSAFRAPGRNFLTPYDPELLLDDTEIDVSHEAFARAWQRMSAQSIDEIQDRRMAGYIANSKTA
jgi:hypothetical protein